MTTLFLIFLTVIVSSAFCALVEAAILSLPLIRARILFEQKRKNAKDLVYIKEHIAATITAIVIINNAINIAGSIYIGELASEIYGDQWLGLISAVVTFVIVIFSEAIPKTIGERFRVPIALFTAPIVRVILFIFTPIVNMIKFITSALDKHHHVPKVTEDEIMMMLKLGRDAGTVEMDEEVLCNRVFKLNDLKAFQIMKPLEEIFTLQADSLLSDVREKILTSPYSRIAVYSKDPHDFIGMVQQRALLKELALGNVQAKIRDFMIEPIFVNDHTKADALLAKFQAYHQHIFVVQDAQGKDIGIITMEDVLEELFGEIYDEKDILKRHESGK